MEEEKRSDQGAAERVEALTVREACEFKESDFLGSGGGKFREIAGMILSDMHICCAQVPCTFRSMQ